MMEQIDLVEDLRLNHKYCPKDVIVKAADELEQLRAKVAELETALRDAKEALLGVLDNQERGAEYWSVSGGVYEAFECNSAIKNINKVLGEE